MAFYRVLGWIGRSLITAGTILLLFVAYQLWGTGIHTAAAQNDLENQFGDQLVALAEDAAAEDRTDGSLPPTTVPADASGWGDGMGIGQAFGLDEDAIAELPPPLPGDGAGRIKIPSINSDWWYVEGVDLTWLRDGPGHFPGTSWPGQTGNAALAGHRTTYGAPFHRIDEVAPGDEILVDTVQGEFLYEAVPIGDLVDGMPIAIDDPADADKATFVIQPEDAWILDDYSDDRLTLMACHPKYSAAQRIVLVAELKGPAAVSTPPSEEVVEELATGEDTLLGGGSDLLGNEQGARLPALLWGLAAAAVWFTAWQVGRTWRRAKWPAYVLGTPVFLLVLFVCFTQVERLLPAAY